MSGLTQADSGGSLNSTTSSCLSVTSIEVEIITSKVGFEDNP